MPPASLKHPVNYGQLIIAAGDEETSPAELIDWVHPVLCGTQGGLWLACEIAVAARGCLTVRIRSGQGAPHLALCRPVPRRLAKPVLGLLPAPPPIAVILLDEHAAQVMTLLDGMARWLNVFEAEDPCLAPIIRMLSDRPGRRPQQAQAKRAAGG